MVGQYHHMESYTQIKNQIKKIFFYKKSHLDNNFIEPIFTFLQSVGISQLIQVPENFQSIGIIIF